jgi:uncharacterized protein
MNIGTGVKNMTDYKHTNRLIDETSPYLLQHAHNPVDWYAWGEEALKRAKQEDKPILLSIGYSACHWCHVMEHESFEDEETARLMNEHFVNIKVDREERPDLDQIYMTSVQMMTGHGGWPLTVFLTPDLVPFYGGTYFPPEDRYNMPGFPRVLISVAQAYRSRPEEIKQTAWSILSELRRTNLTSESKEVLTTSVLDSAYRGISRTFDPTHGGFGNAPKFPAPMVLEFLLRTYTRTGETTVLNMVTTSCRKMAEGGLYDQIGGGFHRYSTDAQWLVPHFEKMLYDNAQLSLLYAHLYQVTNDDHFRQIAESTLDYVIREMKDDEGGFYSTQDADSEGVEGKFFVWSEQEIKEILGETDGELFCAIYGVTHEGNFEEKNILHVARDMEDVARHAGVPVYYLENLLDRAKQELFQAREKRIKPGRDEKILTAWNGMMMASFAECSAIFNRPDYREVAIRNAQFLLSKLEKEGLLLRTYKDGQSKLNAYLEDYSYLADGLIKLYEVTGDLRWLQEATRITDKMVEEFWDSQEGGFFYTGKSHENLIVRNKDFFDNATPSGNSVAAELLLRLSVLTGNEEYRRYAINILRLVHEMVTKYPSAFGRTLCAIDFYLSTPLEIAVVGNYGADEIFAEVWKNYLPNKVIALSADAVNESTVPLLKGRTAIGGAATVYLCENYSCQMPVTTAGELSDQLALRRRASSN